MLVVLVVHQYRMKNPLMPVKRLATTFPVAALIAIICASSSGFGLMELVQTALATRSGPGHIALLFLPEFGAAALTAVLFGLIIPTRFIPLLAFAGLLMLTLAAAILTEVAGDSGAAVALAAGLIGLGVGASVSPSLFIAGLSLRSAEIQRVFALIELLRGVAAFLFAPLLLYTAVVAANAKPEGYAVAAWLCLAITAGAVLAVSVFVLGRGRLQAPAPTSNAGSRRTSLPGTHLRSSVSSDAESRPRTGAVRHAELGVARPQQQRVYHRGARGHEPSDEVTTSHERTSRPNGARSPVRLLQWSSAQRR